MKKFNKLSRIIAIGTVLALLVVVAPVSTVLAAGEDIELDPEEGEIDEWVDVEGDDFIPSNYTTPTYSEVDIYFSSQEADEGDDIDSDVDIYEKVKSRVLVDESGNFDTRFRVPDVLEDGDEEETVGGGTYYVYATYDGADNIEAAAEFTVIAAEISLSPDDGAVGTEVEVMGVDFAEDENIEVTCDGEEVNIESGDDETDGNGTFTLTIVIPESTAGEHTIKVTAGDTEAELDFTVEPELTVNTDSGSPDDSITISGTGFGRRVDVTIEFDGDEVQSDETDNDGSFEVIIKVPVKSAGIYEIEAEDDDNNKAEVNFTVASKVQLGQATGNVDSQVTISGAGFTPGALVDITYDNKPVATATADASGRFSATFTAPKSTAGPHTVTASDGINTAPPVTFTMESTPPPVPQPLLPENETKAKSQATFEWQAVTDPSEPVTYSLRITTSADSLVLEKTGLTETTYTLTKDEKLESTEKEAPYYWSVQAVDGADNASGWTALQSFYVGFTFALSGWVLYVLMGLAGVILLLVGILVGRRLAYY